MLFPIILKSLRNSLETTNIHYRFRVRNELFIFNIDEKMKRAIGKIFPGNDTMPHQKDYAQMHKTKADSISNPIINFR